MVKKLIFKISEEGAVSMEVSGAVGNECEKISAPFEAALGEISKRELKDTYYQSAESQVNEENYGN